MEIESNIEKQLRLFKEYGIYNKYYIDGNNIIIEDKIEVCVDDCDKDFLKNVIIKNDVIFENITKCDKDFLKHTKIYYSLFLPKLKECPNGFLESTEIGGSILLFSVEKCDKDFLKNKVIIGALYMSSLEQCDKEFLNRTILGNLYLRNLKSFDKDLFSETVVFGHLFCDSLSDLEENVLKNNIKKVHDGFNKDQGYCYFDGFLFKVIKVSKKKEYTIYESPFRDFIIQKGNFIAHSTTIKKGILDVEFKIVADKIKNDPINEDTIITVKLYRMLTGACDFGCRLFMNNHNLPYKIINEGTIEEETIEQQVMDAKEFITYLEKDENNYGYEKFKSLITF